MLEGQQIVDISCYLLGDVNPDADKLGAVFGDHTVRIDEGVVVVFNDESSDEAASILSNADFDEALHCVIFFKVA